MALQSSVEKPSIVLTDYSTMKPVRFVKQEEPENLCEDLMDNTSELSTVEEIRCYFCYESVPPSVASCSADKDFRSKIEFVLTVWLGMLPSDPLTCCSDCRLQFDAFHRFKTTCLTTLSHLSALAIFPARGRCNPPVAAEKQEEKIENPIEGPEALEDSRNSFEAENSQNQRKVLTPAAENQTVSVELVKCEFNNESSQLESSATDFVNCESNNESSQMECSTEPEQYTCNKCGIVCRLEHNFRSHQERCNSQSLFECHMCEKTFTTSQMLKYHLNIHNGDRPFRCRKVDCDWSFHAPSNRLQHERICGKQQAYECNICGRMCITSSNLEKHKASCRGSEGWPCEICSKIFPTKTRLEYHMRIHTGEKPNSCRKGCGASFRTPSNQYEHEKSCGKSAQLVCQLCGVQRKTKKTLQKHMETHGPPKYRCNVCDRMMMTKITWHKHLLMHKMERKNSATAGKSSDGEGKFNSDSSNNAQ
ncbi:zinc finger protein 3-like [Uranotaenia lowii]|uniref:zinc finger protein 3-like n=1 Tax=Uranotaenia lowii TaxID=190385 RepID=UPI0024788C96|nr:zinc finger protein 3-like [Uranotaenia lowii]